MTNGDYDMEDIERYVLGVMQPVERRAFDRLMSKNQDLQQEVSDFRAMIGYLQESKERRDRIKSVLQQIESEQSPLTEKDLLDSEE